MIQIHIWDVTSFGSNVWFRLFLPVSGVEDAKKKFKDSTLSSHRLLEHRMITFSWAGKLQKRNAFITGSPAQVQSSSNSTRDVDTAEWQMPEQRAGQARQAKQHCTLLSYTSGISDCGCKNYCYMMFFHFRTEPPFLRSHLAKVCALQTEGLSLFKCVIDWIFWQLVILAIDRSLTKCMVSSLNNPWFSHIRSLSVASILAFFLCSNFSLLSFLSILEQSKRFKWIIQKNTNTREFLIRGKPEVRPVGVW